TVRDRSRTVRHGWTARPSVRQPLTPQVLVVAREACARREIELPMVQAAREHAVVDLTEAREVGLAVRAPPLDAPAVGDEELVITLSSLEIGTFDVRDPLG